MCFGPVQYTEEEWARAKRRMLILAKERQDPYYKQQADRIQAERDALAAEAKAEVRVAVPTTTDVMGRTVPEWLKPRIIQANNYAPIAQTATVTR